MIIKISKSDYKNLVVLTDKAYGIINNKNPTVREINVARLLRKTMRDVARRNKNNTDNDTSIND